MIDESSTTICQYEVYILHLNFILTQIDRFYKIESIICEVEYKTDLYKCVNIMMYNKIVKG